MAALSSLGSGFDQQTAEDAPIGKAEALAVLDDAILFLSSGIGGLQEK